MAAQVQRHMERKALHEEHHRVLVDVVEELEHRMALLVVRRMEVADCVKARHTGRGKLVVDTDYGMVHRKVAVAGAGILDFLVAVDILDSVEVDSLAAAAEVGNLAVVAGEQNLDYAVGEGSLDYVAGTGPGVGNPAAGRILGDLTARRNPVEADNPAEDTGLAGAVDILL